MVRSIDTSKRDISRRFRVSKVITNYCYFFELLFAPVIVAFLAVSSVRSSFRRYAVVDFLISKYEIRCNSPFFGCFHNIFAAVA